ncbi:hypothetical protein [Mucilaginibacter sp. BT774]|uniref:hypothetical protein n=1 Tax=Mucilaginibacter sp. BT774 TaxID=3062276 RepID=UPI002675ACC9|nr:hypothetical protein [Mucilaginibacter sp. BT774]
MKIRLKSGFMIMLLLLIVSVKVNAHPQKFEKAELYEVMKSGSLDAINNELEIVRSAPEKERDGYEGALLMRKAGLLKKPKDRLSTFKQGRIKLETALLADPENAELHFLRLIIEEHAPKIVKYHSDIEKDRAQIIKDFKSLSAAVRHAILDYCEKSKVLHKEDF